MKPLAVGRQQQIPGVIDALHHHITALEHHFFFVGVGFDEQNEAVPDYAELEPVEVVLYVAEDAGQLHVGYDLLKHPWVYTAVYGVTN